MFTALLLTQQNKQTVATFERMEPARLPPGDVTVRVEYSSLNFKDALAVTGRGAIVRKWPLVPGIDLAGVVEHSDDAMLLAQEIQHLRGFLGKADNALREHGYCALSGSRRRRCGRAGGLRAGRPTSRPHRTARSRSDLVNALEQEKAHGKAGGIA